MAKLNGQQFPQQLSLFDSDAPEFVKPTSDYDMADFVAHADFWHGSEARELHHDADTEWAKRHPTMHVGTMAAAEHRVTRDGMMNAGFLHPIVVPPEQRPGFRMHAGRVMRDRLDNTQTDEDEKKAGLDYISWERNKPIYYRNTIEDVGAVSAVAPIQHFTSYTHELRKKQEAGVELTPRQQADLHAGHTSLKVHEEHGIKDDSIRLRDESDLSPRDMWEKGGDIAYESSVKHIKRKFG